MVLKRGQTQKATYRTIPSVCHSEKDSGCLGLGERGRGDSKGGQHGETSGGLELCCVFIVVVVT